MTNGGRHTALRTRIARSNPASAQYQREVMGCGAPIGGPACPRRCRNTRPIPGRTGRAGATRRRSRQARHRGCGKGCSRTSEQAGRSRPRPRTAPASPVHAETGPGARTSPKGTSRRQTGRQPRDQPPHRGSGADRQHFASKDIPGDRTRQETTTTAPNRSTIRETRPALARVIMPGVFRLARPAMAAARHGQIRVTPSFTGSGTGASRLAGWSGLPRSGARRGHACSSGSRSCAVSVA